jgi:hypothetical protein
MDEHIGIPNWRIYERFVASLYSCEASDTLTVIPNAELVGLSGIKRQIDLLIDTRLEEDVSRRVIIDAKCRNRKIDITDVEAFEGMMRDCRAHRGILVCTSGFTEGASLRAQAHIGLRLVPLQDLESLDLTAWENCKGVCSSISGRVRKGWVLYDTAIGPVNELRRTVTAFSHGEPPACAKAGTAKVSMSAAILNVATEVILLSFIRVALSHSIEFQVTRSLRWRD